jgi:hypothetical protein
VADYPSPRERPARLSNCEEAILIGQVGGGLHVVGAVTILIHVFIGVDVWFESIFTWIRTGHTSHKVDGDAVLIITLVACVSQYLPNVRALLDHPLPWVTQAFLRV